MDHKEKVKTFFQIMNKDNISQTVPDFYDSKATFIDPIQKLKGSKKVEQYYAGLYEKVEDIRFDFPNMYQEDNTVVAVWKMTLKTKSLNGGDPVVVDGNSVITFNDEGKAIYHRDYFDMGEFIYEHVPVLGFMVKKIKERMK